MSGVAKDETNPTSATPGEPAAPVSEPAAVPAEPETALSTTAAAEAEARATRRAAPHLRVVTDNEAGFVAPVAEDDDSPTQRMGFVIRAARENQGLTLEQVSKEIRVTVSHLRAIEDMQPNIIGNPVYVRGHIRTYAKHLGMNPDTTIERYLAECAILKDPEKHEIAPPVVQRKLPVAVPVLGILVLALMGAAGFFLVSGQRTAAPAAPEVETAASASSITAPATVVPQGPVLRIVALKTAHIEVRSADGTKMVGRDFYAGQAYNPRVGAGYTVSASDGTAFEWRLGDQSLGPLSDIEGPVNAQSVDIAAKRIPIAVEAPAVTEPTTTGATTTPTITRSASDSPVPPTPKPKPVAATTRPSSPQAQAQTPPAQAAVTAPPAPAPTQAIAAPTPASDASAAAYPDNN